MLCNYVTDVTDVTMYQPYTEQEIESTLHSCMYVSNEEV